MKRRALTVIAVAAVSLSLASGATAQGAGQPDENASCMGKVRATENSAGGIREKGKFGQDQSNFQHFLHEHGANYGQAIASDFARC